MKALAVCPTYGRLPYLGRMLASFLSQTYDDKHLILINDDHKINLKCDYDNVTIFNLNKKLILSEKRNLGSSYGYYDIIFPWDDDDIYLPDRIENHIKKYDSDKNIKSYFNSMCYVIYNNNFFISNPPPTSISYRREEWFRVGGYGKNSVGEDQEFFNKLNIFSEKDETHIDFIYVFSGVNYHASYYMPNEKYEEISKKQIDEMGITDGIFKIEPDFIEYFKYLKLRELYDVTNSPISVEFYNNSKIVIPI